MKRIFQTLLLLFLSAPSLFAQKEAIAYARKNANVTLTLDWRNIKYGTLKWQQSNNDSVWTDIPGASGRVIEFKPAGETWVRCTASGDGTDEPTVRTFHVLISNFTVDLAKLTPTTATFKVRGLDIPRNEIVEWGFCHNYNGLSRTYGNMYREAMGKSLPEGEPLTLTCTGLEPNSSNHVRVYFKTRAGSIVYGPGKLVNTTAGLAWSSEDWQIGKTSVTARFKIAGHATVGKVRFMFGPKGNQAEYTAQSKGNGIYEAQVTGLNPATDYQATASAEVDGKVQTIRKTVRTWTDYSSYPVDTQVKPVSHHIVWNETNRIKLSPDNVQAEYARLVRVNDDTLLLTYHGGDGTDGNTDHWQNIYLQRSADNGQTWSSPEKMMDYSKKFSTLDYGWKRFADPTFTRLSNGWILMQFVGNANPETNQNCQVFVSISRDGGTTWGDPITVGRGRMWEPQIVQLPGGELELLVSSEARWWLYQRDNLYQEILCSRSTDNGLTWTAFTRASYNPDKRDGMPVPVVLQGNKGVLFSIESINSNDTPSLIYRPLSGEWDATTWDGLYDNDRWVATPIKGALAPYILQIPSGEVILMGHMNPSGSVWQTNREAVCIGDNTGHGFKHRTLPFAALPAGHGAYYGSLFLKDANTVWLAYTHSIYNGSVNQKNTIEAIEGRIEADKQ